MEINEKLVIPFLTLIFLFTMNMDLDFDILKYFEGKKLDFSNKSEASEVKKILLWNFLKTNRSMIQLIDKL